MNEKHAREARIVNRVVGRLVKKSQIPLDGAGRVMIGDGKHHKLPRAVKRMWEGMTHRKRARTSLYWRSGVAASLKARGIELDPPGSKKSARKGTNPASRSARANDRRVVNEFINELQNSRLMIRPEPYGVGDGMLTAIALARRIGRNP